MTMFDNVSIDDHSKMAVPKAVREASNKMRDQILQADEFGVFLGSEEDLLNQLEISRPTFRQVARLLEQEQLLTIKRGPGGGFFSQKPSFSGVTHQASVCLVANKAKFSDLHSVGRALSIELAVQAANNPDQQLRAKPMAYIGERAKKGVDVSDLSLWVQTTYEFTRVVLEVANNPALDMFIHITRKFADQLASNLRWIEPENIALYQNHQLKVADAIKQGDADYAALAAARMNDLITGEPTV